MSFSCSKARKLECKEPCTWVVGKGCKGPTDGRKKKETSVKMFEPVSVYATVKEPKINNKFAMRMLSEREKLRSGMTKLQAKVKELSIQNKVLKKEKSALEGDMKIVWGKLKKCINSKR